MGSCGLLVRWTGASSKAHPRICMCAWLLLYVPSSKRGMPTLHASVRSTSEVFPYRPAPCPPGPSNATRPCSAASVRLGVASLVYRFERASTRLASVPCTPIPAFEGAPAAPVPPSQPPRPEGTVNGGVLACILRPSSAPCSAPRTRGDVRHLVHVQGTRWADLLPSPLREETPSTSRGRGKESDLVPVRKLERS